MAGDWHFSPEAEEQRAKSRQNLKEKAEKYNDSAFTPDSKMPLDLKVASTFENFYETLCYNIAADGLVKMPVSAIRRKLSKYMSKNFVDKFTKLAQDYSDGKIDAEKFLNETQTLGNKAQKYFYDSAYDLGELDYVRPDKNKPGTFGYGRTGSFGVEQATKPFIKEDKKAVSSWAKNAAKEADGSKLATIAKAIEGFDSSTDNHIKNVGLMLDKYINDPAISKWLKGEGYDVDKLKKAIKLVGESHDDGKLLVLLEDIETKRVFNGNNPVSAHEPKGKDFLKSILTREEDAIPGAKNHETFSGMAMMHNDKAASTPLEQLVSAVDRLEAAASPRSYKVGTNPKEESWAWKVFKQDYNFPDDVRKSLGDNYDSFYRDALEKRLGKKIGNSWDDVKKAQQELIKENPIGAHHNNIQKVNYASQEAVIEPTKKVLGKELKNTAQGKENKPSVSSIRTEAYNKYKTAFPSASGKMARKATGFVADTVGLDPMSIMVKTIKDGGPERLKKRLGKFNERFQASDQDDIKKEAIQYLTDNWDNLSDADRSYFKYRIEKDNKDFINGR